MKQAFKHFVVAVLTKQAAILLARHQPKIIVVVGSVGKTSTKDAIYSVLKRTYRTRKSDKSFNSEIGIPLTILGIPNAWNNPFLWIKNIIDGAIVAFFSREYPEYLVIEAGVDRPGDMQRLARFLKPDIIVVTRLPDVPVHVEFFDSPEAVADEKMSIISALKPDGIVIYNHDDIEIETRLRDVRQAAIGFSRIRPSHYTASKDQIVYNDDQPIGLSFTVSTVAESHIVRATGAVGLPLLYTYLAAIAVGGQCGISTKDAVDALLEHEPPAGRMRILKGLKGSILIDDTYNASPEATLSALTTLSELGHTKRKIAVLGDMLELGRYSTREHEKIGEFAASTVDMLITIGVRARAIAEAALEHGLHESKILQYDDAAKAGKELQGFLAPGDTVLVKASQSIRAERVVEEVMAEPNLAPSLLVRQDTAWQNR